MADPRERIEVNGLVCERNVDGTEEFWIRDAQYDDSVVADWGTTVAFAQAILAADAEWREANAPTFVELREKYPDRNFWLLPHNCANDCVRTDMDGDQRGHVSMGHALEWLAAKLAEGGSDE